MMTTFYEIKLDSQPTYILGQGEEEKAIDLYAELEKKRPAQHRLTLLRRQVDEMGKLTGTHQYCMQGYWTLLNERKGV